MLESTKHRLRGIAIKKRLREIAGLEGDALTAEIRSEADGLQTELADVETREAAAIASEPDPEVRVTDTTDPEVRERLELRGRASFGRYLMARMQGRSVLDGADAEFAAAHGITDIMAPVEAGGGVPLDLWEQDRPQPETRAATPAPATGTGTTVAPISPFLFSPSIAPILNIAMPSVPSGSWSEMTVTTSVPAGAVAKGGDASDTAGALTARTTGPRRISARLELTLEDIAAVGQAGFESTMRENASMRLSDEYDLQCIAGDGVAPNVAGLLGQLNDPTDPTMVAKFDDWVSAYADAVDGLWANETADVRMIVAVAAYRLAAKSFRGDATAGAPNQTAAQYLKGATGGFTTNKRFPAPVSNIAKGIIYRMGRGVRTAVHPVWNRIAVDDPYTLSRSGQRAFTMHVLVGDKVLLVQPDAYSAAEFKVA